MKRRLRDVALLLARSTGRWAVLAAGLNFLWEIAQVPLYTIYEDESALAIGTAVVHCTLGDTLIAAASYLVAAAATRQVDWPRGRALLGGCVAISAGLSYTVFSEWLNVSVLRAWAYADSMPRVYGIGLSPLLQWIVLPTLVLLLVRNRPSPRIDRRQFPSRERG